MLAKTDLFIAADTERATAATRILLTATLRWPIASRLAMSFAKMGCQVHVLCPREHPASRTRAVERIRHYATLMPLRSLRAAVEAAAPDLIIPCDDDAAAHLHRLYQLGGKPGHPAGALRALIGRSLGSPEASPLAIARGRLAGLALEEGVRIPNTAVIASAAELSAWIGRNSLPAVIKVDHTWGGQGVSIVSDHEQTCKSLRLLSSRPSIPKVIARLLLDRDLSFLVAWLNRTQGTVTVQKYIRGVPANRAVACWQGKVLAGISVEAIRTQHATGPATVIRVIENPEMTEAVGRLVRRLGVSGLWGVDFMIEASTGAAYMIEANPRATPICHLPLGAGRNLPAAILEQLSEIAPSSTAVAVPHDLIVMFPGEWRRDPASSFLHSAYHDVPWEESGLVRECIDVPWEQRGWLARAWGRFRPRSDRLCGTERTESPIYR